MLKRCFVWAANHNDHKRSKLAERDSSTFSEIFCGKIQKITTKNESTVLSEDRCYLGFSSHAASLANAKWHFAAQHAHSFRIGRISIHLKLCCSANLQNWILYHDRRFLYRFYGCVYSLEACTNG